MGRVPRDPNLSPGDETMASMTTKTGISLGSCIAAVISYNANHSILWAIIHAVFGWFYVAYYVLKQAL